MLVEINNTRGLLKFSWMQKEPGAKKFGQHWFRRIGFAFCLSKVAIEGYKEVIRKDKIGNSKLSWHLRK